MEERRDALRGLVEKRKGKRSLGRLKHKLVNNIKRIFKKYIEDVWEWVIVGMGYCGSGLEQVAGSCERGDELSVSITCRKFLD
jgi:hypothetical protein